MQARDKVVKVVLAGNTFTILNCLSGEFICSGTASTPHQLKIQVKAKLKELGVLFADEVRKKAPGELAEVSASQEVESV
jgi:hypothetical protein